MSKWVHQKQFRAFYTLKISQQLEIFWVEMSSLREWIHSLKINYQINNYNKYFSSSLPNGWPFRRYLLLLLLMLMWFRLVVVVVAVASTAVLSRQSNKINFPLSCQFQLRCYPWMMSKSRGGKGIYELQLISLRL